MAVAVFNNYQNNPTVQDRALLDDYLMSRGARDCSVLLSFRVVKSDWEWNHPSCFSFVMISLDCKYNSLIVFLILRSAAFLYSNWNCWLWRQTVVEDPCMVWTANRPSPMLWRRWWRYQEMSVMGIWAGRCSWMKWKEWDFPWTTIWIRHR